MSFDAGGLAHMTYNSNNGFPSCGLGAPNHGFGNRSRLNSKRLSVALPPKVGSISENQVDNPTPRTSRSHLLAGLRTQPKTPSVPASAPYNQTQHHLQSKWADAGYHAYDQSVPQTATGAGFDLASQYAVNAGRQMYSLPEQVLAPPTLDQGEEMDPAMLQQMQMTSLYLAQRQQQLQQQLATLTASAQGLSLNTNMQRNPYQQSPMTPQTPHGLYGNQQIQSPIEVQPGVYLVFNPATQNYTYVLDQNLQQQLNTISPVQQNTYWPSPQTMQPPTPSVSVTPPTELPNPLAYNSYSPPKTTPSPPGLDNVEPLPPPSTTAFRRGASQGHAHKKSASLTINPYAEGAASTGPKTSSNATFGAARAALPTAPMTGTFGPGAARAGEHPVRQPRGPPPLEELLAAPTALHEGGSKNFASRQRRRALDSLVRAGTSRRVVGRSEGGSGSGSPGSEREEHFASEDDLSVTSAGSRKMSPIGSEMKGKRGSQGSSDGGSLGGSDGGYFGLSSASSSEGEEAGGAWKLPPTPATPVGAVGGERKKMMLGVLNAAEKRRGGF